MRLSTNLLAAVLNSGLNALITLLATPFYLRYMGEEAYGLVSLYLSMMVLLTVLDLGMAPSISRLVAWHAGKGRIGDAVPVLVAVERLYWIVALVVALVFLCGAPLIAHYWVRPVHLKPAAVSHAIVLMGLAGAARWSATIYNAVLQGAQQLKSFAVVNIPMNAFGAITIVLVLARFGGSVDIFFIGQAVFSMLTVLLLRRAAWRSVERDQPVLLEWRALREIWGFSIGMAVLTLSSVCVLQLDRLMLSRIVSLSDYGRYSVSSLLAGSIYLLVTPINGVIFARFTSLLAAERYERLQQLFRLMTRLVVVLVFSAAATIALYASSILLVWTGNKGLAEDQARILVFLALGAALHGVSYLPYTLQLVSRKMRIQFVLNLVLLLIYAPLLYVLIASRGALGAAQAWFVLHVLYLCLQMVAIKRSVRFLAVVPWLTKEVLWPVLLISVLAGGLCHFLDGISTAVTIYALVPRLILTVSCLIVVGLLGSPALLKVLLRSAGHYLVALK